MLSRAQALLYVGYHIDNAQAVISLGQDIPENARLVGYQCGFKPMVVAVSSYFGGEIDAKEAEELAADYLDEINWFSDGPVAADFVI